MLFRDSECQGVRAKLRSLFADPRHGKSIGDDLQAGLAALPVRTQEFLRGWLIPASESRNNCPEIARDDQAWDAFAVEPDSAVKQRFARQPTWDR